jgi:hypothetical protein
MVGAIVLHIMVQVGSHSTEHAATGDPPSQKWRPSVIGSPPLTIRHCQFSTILVATSPSPFSANPLPHAVQHQTARCSMNTTDPSPSPSPSSPRIGQAARVHLARLRKGK